MQRRGGAWSVGSRGRLRAGSHRGSAHGRVRPSTPAGVGPWRVWRRQAWRRWPRALAAVPTFCGLRLVPASVPCRFDVGAGSRGRLRGRLARRTRGGRGGGNGWLSGGCIHLRQCLRLQFQAAGVLPEHIDSSSDCTHCDPAGRFYSFRRSGRLTGQLAGFIVAAGKPRRGLQQWLLSSAMMLIQQGNERWWWPSTSPWPWPG